MEAKRPMQCRAWATAMIAAAWLAACGGGGGGGGGSAPPPAAYTIGGTASGLTGAMTLQNGSADNLSVAANGAFIFATGLASGAGYSVTVLTPPTGQTCAVTNGSGSVASANVTNVAVTCTAAPTGTHTLGGSVSGLTGSVTLQNNGADNLAVSANGAFTFATPLPAASPYAVTLGAQPAGQTCVLANGVGTVGNANVTNIILTCGNAPKETVLYTFGASSNYAAGYYPTAKLVQTVDGTLYGTTSAGGSSEFQGGGTAFKITTSGAFTKLADLPGAIYGGKGGLVLGDDGNLYGLTDSSFFRVTPAGSVVVLHTFTFSDGGPTSGLVRGGDGNFYGAAAGSQAVAGLPYDGSIYRISPTGTFATVYPTPAQVPGLSGHPELQLPRAREIVQGADGSLYGSTGSVVFALPPSGTPRTVYPNPAPSNLSIYGMMMASDGNLYLSAIDTAQNANVPTIVRLTTGGSASPLHAFSASSERGRTLQPLFQSPSGNFYGSTVEGGANGLGFVYRLTPAGALTVLYSFAGTDGYYLVGSLLLGLDGSFYAATEDGGTGNCSLGCGTVAKIDVGPVQ